MNEIEMEFDEFMSLMKETTNNLKKMTEVQSQMRWQFDYPDTYELFI
jgi:hypothetical protein